MPEGVKPTHGMVRPATKKTRAINEIHFMALGHPKAKKEQQAQV
jgi:hypothetical protein